MEYYLHSTISFILEQGASLTALVPFRSLFRVLTLPEDRHNHLASNNFNLISMRRCTIGLYDMCLSVTFETPCKDQTKEKGSPA